ncbi:MAG TPA: glycoside hydrolase family 25 protein [Kofleriaceae bacterium]|nr:glycoside hydrolase family 25 protein [Kofleriaceae bacterium]
MLAAAALGAGLALWNAGRARPLKLETAACETGPTVRGIDVSHHQETISWRRVRQAGVQFAFIRVSDGLTTSDEKFAENWSGARRVGVLRGAYQYFRPEESPIAQADLVIAALRRDPGELPPVIDVEADGGKTPTQLEVRVRAWVDRVRDQLRVEPIVYTGPDFWRERAGGADLTRQPLWLAHYTADCPAVPAPWTRWTFWQHTDRGVVPGIDGPVDLDLFAGDYLALEELARRSRLGDPDAERAALR